MLSPALFTSVINHYLPEPHASLLNGILFGINLQANEQFYRELKTVGLLHIVVLSGMNITLIGSLVCSITSRLSRVTSIMISILFIVFFVIFVGAKAPIIRAGFMSILTLVSFIFKRKNTALFGLFLSGIFIFIFWPQWITSVSFQLSFGATLGIILFAPQAQQSHSSSSFIQQTVINNLKLSLAAQVFTAPIICIYFKQISFISPLSNLLVSFTIGPLMVFGFLTAIVGVINKELGLIPGYISYGILHYIILVIKILAQVPFATLSF